MKQCLRRPTRPIVGRACEPDTLRFELVEAGPHDNPVSSAVGREVWNLATAKRRCGSQDDGSAPRAPAVSAFGESDRTVVIPSCSPRPIAVVLNPRSCIAHEI